MLAGGPGAVSHATESAEDDYDAGALDLPALTARDAVVGISASGRTPYVLGAVEQARRAGALTIGLVCNAGSASSAAAVELPIEVVVGPEFIAGSTRLKAGTAQKLVLNMLSTLTMVRLGQDLREPDGRRAGDQREAARPRDADRRAGDRRAARRGRRRRWQQAGDEAKVAIVMLRAKVSADEARDRLRGRRPARSARRMRVAGLMSGTSFDAIDAAVADIELDGDAVTLQAARVAQRAATTTTLRDEIAARGHGQGRLRARHPHRPGVRRRSRSGRRSASARST